MRALHRIVVVLVLLPLLLATVGATFQRIGTAIDSNTTRASGRFVELEGHRMHLHCTGAGSPTVVLETGAGTPGAMWDLVQPQIANSTRVCSYDRAGLGLSEGSPNPRDAGSVAQELHTLLVMAGETAPYLLVGHSLGGQYALMFAHRYRRETQGVVLLDAQHPDMLFRTPAAQSVFSEQKQQIRWLKLLSVLGVVRALNMSPADSRLPAGAQAALNTAKNRTELVVTLEAELNAIPTTREQLRAVGHFGDLPLVVVSATQHGTPELEDYALGLQRELAGLSSNSRHDVVVGADHTSLVLERRHVDRTVRAINSVVQMV